MSAGRGILRRDPAIPQSYRGQATIAGFPYDITAVVEADAHGKYFVLSFAITPIPHAAGTTSERSGAGGGCGNPGLGAADEAPA